MVTGFLKSTVAEAFLSSLAAVHLVRRFPSVRFLAPSVAEFSEDTIASIPSLGEGIIAGSIRCGNHR